MKIDLLKLAERYKNTPGTLLFLSSGDHPHSKQSFLCLNPVKKLTLFEDKWILESDSKTTTGFHTNPWDSLKEHLQFSQETDAPGTPKWGGYLSYEMGAFTDQDERLPFLPPSIPLAQFYHYERVLTSPPLKIKPINLTFSSSDIPPYGYLAQIESIQQQISNGDVYQVNLSHEMEWEFAEDPFRVFQELIHLSPTPFGAYLHSDDFTLISSSPERLIEKRGSRLKTSPIKGTAPRGKTPVDDEITRNKLLNSMKDKAELLMITDLMRNDLGKICTPGTVDVPTLMRLERYPHVFHLVSEIEGDARSEISPVEILRALFPGGSVTGCPKLSAMRSILQHEQRPRGIYTGSIGYFTADGDFDFNICIRTLLHQNRRLSCGLGGAIVSDSIPAEEFQETFHKGALIKQIIK